MPQMNEGIKENVKAAITCQNCRFARSGNVFLKKKYALISRTNSKEMKELLGYIERHHEDLEKSFTDEQKEIFEKFHDCWSEYASLAEEAIFTYAFKLGGRLMPETLSEQRKN